MQKEVLKTDSEKILVADAFLTAKIKNRAQFAEFEIITSPASWAMIQVDVDQNGKVDTGDVAYGVAPQYSSPCFVYLLAFPAGATSVCGMFKSAAMLSIERNSAANTLYWKIPKSELSATGDSAQFLIAITRPDITDLPIGLIHYPSTTFAKPFSISFQ